MDRINVMKAIGILYGIPLIALLVGTVGSYYILEPNVSGGKLEVYSFFCGLAVTGLSYVLIRTRDKARKDSRQYMPVVTQILDGIEEEENKEN